MKQYLTPTEVLKYLHQLGYKQLTFDEYIYMIRKAILKKLNYLVSAVNHKEIIYKAVDAGIFKENILWTMKD